MERKVTVGISNHHVHLTEEVYHNLFSTPLTKKKDLHQIGDFASQQVVTLKTQKGILENVRIVGPFRKYNQVEISRSDAYFLGLNPPVRNSWDLEESEEITLAGDIGKMTLKNVCILSTRHVHMDYQLAEELGLINNQKVKIQVFGDKSCLLDAFIKISENGYFELHLDWDDANAAGLKNGDEVKMLF